MARRKAPAKTADRELKGWKAIAEYLAIPVSTAHRWARDGMPVRKEGRVMVSDPKDLSEWLGRTAHMPGPAEILTNQTDVAGALKESISAMRRGLRKNRG